MLESLANLKRLTQLRQPGRAPAPDSSHTTVPPRPLATNTPLRQALDLLARQLLTTLNLPLPLHSTTLKVLASQSDEQLIEQVRGFVALADTLRQHLPPSES